jgi:glucosamine--fructose-6-phosphate aminotransferase (isomerizing)
MCGLVGMVGLSKDPELSFKILTSLMKITQKRGFHATGYYYTDINNKVDHYKLGLSSKIFTRLEPWTSLKDVQIKGFIGHTRYSTTGSSRNNINNHPFISQTENIAIVHNGTLNLYHKYKKDYNLKTSCDSELLLRIIVKENNIIKGIYKIYELLGTTGDFACELIYRNQDTNTSNFYFFRDTSRPGRFIDLSEQLGQYFFTSTTEIWNETIQELGLKEFETVEVQKIPPFEILVIETENLNITAHQLQRPKRIIKSKIERPKLNESKPDFQNFLGTIRRNDFWANEHPILTVPKIFKEEQDNDEILLYHNTFGKDPVNGKVVFT